MDKVIKFIPSVLILFHAIGIGLFIYFAAAPQGSYLNILMSAILVLIAEKEMRKALFVFALIFFFGYTVELIGVQTGLLFGSYAYFDSMGPLVFGTPLIIGATWYAVVVGASNLSRFVKANIYGRAVLSGLLAVLMDILIEGVAIKYELWSWEGGDVPFYNYLCWFVFASLFSLIYLKRAQELNKIAIYLFFIWIGFFSILNLF